MSLNPPHVPDDWGEAREVLQRIINLLCALLPGFGASVGSGRSVEERYGTTTITWPGGTATSSTTTVTHGMGRAPVAVHVTAMDSGTFRFAIPVVTAITSTTFTVQAQSNDVSSPGAGTSVGYTWRAIG